MDIKNTDKALKLLEELKELEKYDSIINSKEYKHTTHFEFVQHYGEGAYKVVIDHKYNELFIPSLKKIISEIKKEIEEL